MSSISLPPASGFGLTPQRVHAHQSRMIVLVTSAYCRLVGRSGAPL